MGKFFGLVWGFIQFFAAIFIAMLTVYVMFTIIVVVVNAIKKGQNPFAAIIGVIRRWRHRRNTNLHVV